MLVTHAYTFARLEEMGRQSVEGSSWLNAHFWTPFSHCKHAERCARSLTIFGEEIDAARGREWAFMRYPFRFCSRWKESWWQDDVAMVCDRTGSGRVREAFYLATGGWPRSRG